MEDLTMFNSIISLLDERELEYELLEHEHVHTSEEAAKIRGTNLEEAAKALVLEGGKEKFFMCVVSGHRKLDFKKIRQLVQEKNVRLADPEDVLRITGCKVGTVPPFPALLGVPGFADEKIFDRQFVCFSAASHLKSIRMSARSWQSIAGAAVEDIGKD